MMAGKFERAAEFEVMQYVRNRERYVFRSKRDPEGPSNLFHTFVRGVGGRFLMIELPTPPITVGLR
jgi:hypothetical protein